MDHNDKNTDVDDRRTAERASTEAPVTVRLEPQQIVGPGQNTSEEGVFFVADGALRVVVEVDGGAERAGELVRVQAMGEGKLGIAVRFV